jgi:hypothetical protein
MNSSALGRDEVAERAGFDEPAGAQREEKAPGCPPAVCSFAVSMAERVGL